MNEEEYDPDEDENEDEAQETPSLNDEELHDLAFDFLSELPMGYLGLQNDMIMIFDVKKYYYRLLDSSEQLTSNLILVKNMIQDVYENNNKELYDRIDALPDGMKNKFSKIVFYEILLNRHLFCRTNLVAKHKNQNGILFLDGKAPFKLLMNLGAKAPIEPSESDRFTFYLNIATNDLKLNKNSSIIFEFIRYLSKKDKDVIKKTRNLLLNLITNTPKDHLLFVITSQNKKIISFYIDLIQSLFNSDFCSYYSAKELSKKSTWLSLTTKVVNFTSKIEPNIMDKSEALENLKTLAFGEQSSILKGGRTYNYVNRTVLIFHGSPEEVEPIDKISSNTEKVITISLPDELDPRWDESDIARMFYKKRGDLVLFSYYGFEIEDDDCEAFYEHLDPIKLNRSSNNPSINNIDSIEKFFFEHIEITSNRGDFIFKEALYEKYISFVSNLGLICQKDSAFFSWIKDHASLMPSAAAFKSKTKNSSKEKTYFYEARQPTQEQLRIAPTLANKRIFIGLRYMDDKKNI